MKKITALFLFPLILISLFTLTGVSVFAETDEQPRSGKSPTAAIKSHAPCQRRSSDTGCFLFILNTG